MSLIQILFGFYFAILGALLSIFMAKLLQQNGRVLKRMEEGFKRMDEGFRITGEKMDEGFRILGEGHTLIARLIAKEDEKRKGEILKDLEGGS